MSSIARTLSAALLASGAMVAAGTTQASAACKGHFHSAKGNASGIQYLASVSSKYAWKSVVASHDGAGYDTWGKASVKSVTCKKTGPNKTWECTAKAKPCN